MMRSDPTRWPALAAALITTLSPSARAQTKPPPPIQLALYYDVPQGLSKRCYETRDFQDRVYVAIRYSAFEPPAIGGKLLVRMAEAGPDVEVSWVHEDVEGRPVRPPYKGKAHTCYEALDDAIAALKDYLPPLPPRVSPPPARPVFLSLGGGTGVRLGSGRAPAPGLALDLGVRWREKPVSLAVEVRAALPVATEVQSIPGTRVGTWLMTAALLPCGHYRWLVGCGLVEAGAVRSSGAEIDPSSGDTVGPYVAMGARAGVEIPVERGAMALRLSGDLTGVLTSARILPPVLAGGEEVWHMPRINGAFIAGVVGFFGK